MSTIGPKRGRTVEAHLPFCANLLSKRTSLEMLERDLAYDCNFFFVAAHLKDCWASPSIH